MISEKDIIIDTHAHTVQSKHAYSTIKEIMKQGRSKNLELIAITDHYYENSEDIDAYGHSNTSCVNGYDDRVTIVNGCEFNLVETYKDVAKELSKHVKCRILSFHDWAYDGKKINAKNIFDIYKKGILEVDANILGHIDRQIPMPSIVKLLEGVAEDSGIKDKVYIEINECSLNTYNNCYLHNMEILNLCKKLGLSISLGTDSHYYKSVGDFKTAIKIINMANFPRDKILNIDREKIKETFKI